MGKLVERIDFWLLALGMRLLGMRAKTSTQSQVYRTLLMWLRPLACYCVARSLGRLLTRALNDPNKQVIAEVEHVV